MPPAWHRLSVRSQGYRRSDGGCVRRTVEPVWILGGIAVSLAALVLAAVVLAWAVLEFVTPAKLWGKM
jgi:hypothetical protein